MSGKFTASNWWIVVCVGSAK